MRDAKEVAAELKGFMNNFLRGLQRKVDRMSDSEIESQDAECLFLQGIADGRSAGDWIRTFVDYYSKGSLVVCLWIIKQGHINTLVEMLESEAPGLINHPYKRNS